MKGTVTKSLSKMSDEIMENGLRTDTKLRANYCKTKGTRCNRQTKDWGDQEKVKFLEGGFML